MMLLHISFFVGWILRVAILRYFVVTKTGKFSWVLAGCCYHSMGCFVRKRFDFKPRKIFVCIFLFGFLSIQIKKL